MENKRILYDFCPRCSGLMKNGVCIACGYEKKRTEDAAQQELAENINKTDGTTALQGGAVGTDVQDGRVTRPGSPDVPGGIRSSQNLSAQQAPERKKHTGFIIGICIGGLLFLLVLCIAIYLIVSDVKSHSPSAWNPLQSSDGDEAQIVDDDGAEGYIPDASDEYYVEITDSLRDDLSYQVEWQEYEVENEDTVTSYYALFPVLTGDVSNLEEMNRAIEAVAREEEVFCQYAAEDEDIVTLLQSEVGVAFYTPVGLEVGFNYSSSDSGYGWLTVTVKDYAQYQKKW